MESGWRKLRLMKFSSLRDYNQQTEEAWQRLWKQVATLSSLQLVQRVALKPGGDSRSAKDALAHVYAWHLLLLGWCKAGADQLPSLPADGYKWSQTRDLNAMLQTQYADMGLASVQRRLKLSHTRIVKLVASMDERQLLQAGHFAWTGKLPLASYVAPNTVSHYRWATKKIKALGKALTK